MSGGCESQAPPCGLQQRDQYLREQRERLEAGRKPDIKQIDRIVKEFDLDRRQREELHDEMRREKGKGEKLPQDVIRDIAREIAERDRNNEEEFEETPQQGDSPEGGEGR